MGSGITCVKVRCGKGHEWIPRVANLLYSNSWCPHCYGNVPCKIEDLHEWALELGGRCLSDKYVSNKDKYLWECGQCQHQWEATWNNVKSCSSWCPECKTSIREKITRAAFQENFPGEDFAKNHDAIGMELDGYSATQCLAFEHDGMQHRVRVKHFQREEGDFEAQLERDVRKDDLCDEVGITLIRVPDRGILPHNQIRAFVRDRIIELGYEVPEELVADAVFYTGVRAARGESPYRDEALALIEKKGGAFIDGKALCPTVSYPLHIKCKQGHEFETYYENLKRGRWCPRCGGTAPIEDSAAAAAAKERGYDFLHTENRMGADGKSRKFITLQCPNEDHPPTEILWDNFKKGRGCQKCGQARAGATRRNTNGEIGQRLANFSLTLVGQYKTVNTPTVFECAESHRFTSTMRKVELLADETKCPVCTIEAFEGVSLMDDYGPETDPVKTRLTWRCDKCQVTFQSTYRGMRIRKKFCRNSKCR